jgi:hypothetical protein
VTLTVYAVPRAIATRFEKTARNYLAAIVLWLR